MSDTLRKTTRVEFETFFPFGLFGSATLECAIGDADTDLRLRDRVVLWDSGKRVYEGLVTRLTKDEGVLEVELTGDWGMVMETQRIDRRWCDMRTGQEAWQSVDSLPGFDDVKLDIPGAVQRLSAIAGSNWAANDRYALEYNCPPGETIGYMTWNYDFNEQGQDWHQRYMDGDTAGVIWFTGATGSGSTTATPSPPPSKLHAVLYSVAAQVANNVGVFAEFSSPALYASRQHASATLGNVNAYEIALDAVQRLGVENSYISSSLSRVSSSLTKSVKPFLTSGRESWASILQRICSFGTSGDKPIYAQLLPTWYADDYRPLLELAEFPDTSAGYDYVIHRSKVQATQALDTMANYITVSYINVDGYERRISPVDYATLMDTDSITRYGRQEYELRLGEAAESTALEAGQTLLSYLATPKWSVSIPGFVSELESPSGERIPAIQIVSGKRLRITGLPNLATGEPHTTLLVIGTNYNSRQNGTRVELDNSDSFSPQLARLL